MLKNRKRKGSALLLVVLVFMVIATMSTLMVITLDTTMFEVTTYATQMQASYLAQEAQEAMVAALTDKPPGQLKSIIQIFNENLVDYFTTKDKNTGIGYIRAVNQPDLGYKKASERGYFWNKGSAQCVLKNPGEVIKELDARAKKAAAQKGVTRKYGTGPLFDDTLDHIYTSEAGTPIYMGYSEVTLDVIPARYYVSGTDDKDKNNVEAWAWVNITTHVLDSRAYSRSDRNGADGTIGNAAAGKGELPTNRTEFKDRNSFTYESSILMMIRNEVVHVFNMTPDKLNDIAEKAVIEADNKPR